MLVVAYKWSVKRKRNEGKNILFEGLATMDPVSSLFPLLPIFLSLAAVRRRRKVSCAMVEGKMCEHVTDHISDMIRHTSSLSTIIYDAHLFLSPPLNI
jgi:hypothetical protein